MPAPGLSGFGDGSHAPGTSGITVDGGGFGAFPGSVWIYENDDLTGLADQLTVASWNDVQISVDIPGSLNNAAGTRYLFVQREDLAWSNPLAFTLEAAGGINGALSKTLGTLTVSAVGTLEIQATLSKTLGSLTSSAVGAVALAGAVNGTLGSLGVNAIGAQSSTGNTAATLGALTVSAAGALALAGAVTQTLEGLGCSIEGGHDAGSSGAGSTTLESVACASEGRLAISSSVVVTLGPLTLSTNRNLDVPSKRTFKVPARSNRIYRVA